jgi:hypothetical protein
VALRRAGVSVEDGVSGAGFREELARTWDERPGVRLSRSCGVEARLSRSCAVELLDEPEERCRLCDATWR